MVEVQRIHIEVVRRFSCPPGLPVLCRVNGEGLAAYGPDRRQGRICGGCPVCLIDKVLDLLPQGFRLCLSVLLFVQIAELIVVVEIVPCQISGLEADLRLRIVLYLNDDGIILEDFRRIFIRACIAKTEENGLIRCHQIRTDHDRRGARVVEENHGHKAFQAVTHSRIRYPGSSLTRLIGVVPVGGGDIHDVFLAGDVLLEIDHRRGDRIFRTVESPAFQGCSVFTRNIGKEEIQVAAGRGSMLHRGCTLYGHPHVRRPVMVFGSTTPVTEGAGHVILLSCGHAGRIDTVYINVRALGNNGIDIQLVGAVVDAVPVIPGKDLRAVLAVCDEVGHHLFVGQITAVTSDKVQINISIVRAECDASSSSLVEGFVCSILGIGECRAALPDIDQAVFSVLLDIDVQLHLLVFAGRKRNASGIAACIDIVRLASETNPAVLAADSDCSLAGAVCDLIDQFKLFAGALHISPEEGHVVERQPVSGRDPDAGNAFAVSLNTAVYKVEALREREAVAAISPCGKVADHRRVYLDFQAVRYLCDVRADGADSQIMRFEGAAAHDSERERSGRHGSVGPCLFGLVCRYGSLHHAVHQKGDVHGIACRIDDKILDVESGVLCEVSGRPVDSDDRRAGTRHDLGHSGVQVVGLDGHTADRQRTVCLNGMVSMCKPGDGLCQSPAAGGHRISAEQMAIHIHIDGLFAGAYGSDVECQICIRVLLNIGQGPCEPEGFHGDRPCPAHTLAVTVCECEFDGIGAADQVLTYIYGHFALGNGKGQFLRSSDCYGQSTGASGSRCSRVHRGPSCADRTGGCRVNDRQDRRCDHCNGHR